VERYECVSMSGRKNFCPKENNTESRRMDAEAQVEPIRREALHHKTTCERVQGKQAGKLDDHLLRFFNAEKTFSVVGKPDASREEPRARNKCTRCRG
jgi:hypothetical protein